MSVSLSYRGVDMFYIAFTATGYPLCSEENRTYLNVKIEGYEACCCHQRVFFKVTLGKDTPSRGLRSPLFPPHVDVGLCYQTTNRCQPQYSPMRERNIFLREWANTCMIRHPLNQRIRRLANCLNISESGDSPTVGEHVDLLTYEPMIVDEPRNGRYVTNAKTNIKYQEITFGYTFISLCICDKIYY